jgi:translocation and assembly module TamB
MKKINKILILFIFLVTILFWMATQFVQSQQFGSIVSKIVSKIAIEKFDSSVSFSQIMINLYPPAINLKKIELEHKNLSLLLDEISVGFSLKDIWETKTTLSEIILQDGQVRIRLPEVLESNGSAKDEQKIDFTDIAENIVGSLPIKIRQLKFRDIFFNLNEKHIKLNNLDVETVDSGFIVDFKFHNFLLPLEQPPLDSLILDTIKGKLQLYEDIVMIDNLNVVQGVNVVNASGAVKGINDYKNIFFEITTNITADLNTIHDYLDLKDIGELKRGLVNINAKIKGKIDDVNIDAHLLGKDIITDFADADSLELKLKIDNEKILLNMAHLEYNNSSIILQKPFVFFSFNTRRFIDEEVFTKLDGVSLSNALKYLPDLEPLYGNLSGDLMFVLGENDFHFYPRNGFDVSNVKLQVDKLRILETTKAKLENSSFHVHGEKFSMEVNATINKSEIKARGTASKDGIDFRVDNSNVNLADLGPYAGFEILGEGELALHAFGKGNDVKIVINSNMTNVYFVDYNVDKLDSEIVFDLLENKILFSKVNGLQANAILKANGEIDLSGMNVNVDVQFDKFGYNDFLRLLNPLFKDLPMPNNINGNWSTNVKIGGKLDQLNKLVIDGAFNGLNTFISDEVIDSITFQYQLKESKFFFNDIKAKKGPSELNAYLDLDLISNKISSKGAFGNLPLNEFSIISKLPLNLSTTLQGEYSFELKDKQPQGTFSLTAKNTRIGSKDFESSYMNIDFTSQVLVADLNVLGERFNISSRLDFNELDYSRDKLSFINLFVNANDIKDLLRVFAGVDLSATGFFAETDLEAKSNFNVNNIRVSDVEFFLKKLKIDKDIIKVNYTNKSNPQIYLRDGEIENWDIDISGNRFSLISKGSGDFKKTYDLKTKFSVDSSILEIFNSIISKSSGTLAIRSHYYNNYMKEDFEVILSSRDFAVASELMPTAITRANIEASYRDKKISLDRFDAQLSSGKLSLDGDVNFKNVIPEINIKYAFDKASISIMKKSFVSLNGKGAFVGSTLPYSLTGDIALAKCQILNEVGDFVKGEKILTKDYQYLPDQLLSERNQFLLINFNVTTLEPILIRNSMADIGFVGNLNISGGEKKPKLAGKLSLSSQSNKVFFKNNEFIISKGDITFFENLSYTNPELDFSASSSITDYRVFVKVFGPVESVNLELSSDPPMATNDIFSLIAFGYTDELSNNMTEQEKEQLSRTGVGSMLFDSLKINEMLKSELGLQVNLGTEISQDLQSNLAGRSADSPGTIGRVRTATKLEVKKKLSEKLELSVSSTVGGAITQRQSMNLNYNIKKNVALELIGEVKSSETGEEDITDNSLGADLKFRWSFK